MRNLAIAFALGSTALASPAMAQDTGFYAGIEGGILLMQDPSWDYSDRNVSVNNAYNVDLKTGFDGDVIVGYDLGMLRIEGEFGYKRSSVDSIAVDPVITSTFFGVPFEADGRSSALSAMLNVLFDIDAGGWGAYAGGGIGGARVRTRFNIPDIDRHFSGTDRALAWQAIAGIRAAVSPNIDLGLKYRYFRVPNVDYRWGSDHPDGPFNLDGDWESHSFLASLIYNFGAPPPPPPPPPLPAPPPPPPPTQVCPDGTVIPATEVCPAPPPPPPPPPPAPERG